MNFNLPFLQKFKVNNKNENALLKLILGSGSPRRKEILSKLGIPFEVDPSKFDESILDKNNSNVADYVRRNAIEKVQFIYHPICIYYLFSYKIRYNSEQNDKY